jgi:hypothetical protein
MRNLCLTGGFGRLTESLIRNAVRQGFSIRVSDGLTLTPKNIGLFVRQLKDSHIASSIIGTTSESQIMQQIFSQMIQGCRGLSLRQRDVLEKKLFESTVLETRSKNTGENLANLRGVVSLTGELIISQMPLQELRAFATALKVFENEIKTGQVTLRRFTTEFSRGSLRRNQLIEAVVAEMWRLIIYTAKGDLLLDLNRGIDVIPGFYWESVQYLFEGYPYKLRLRRYLQTMSLNAGHKNKFDLIMKLEPVNEEILKVIDWVYEGTNASSPVDISTVRKLLQAEAVNSSPLTLRDRLTQIEPVRSSSPMTTNTKDESSPVKLEDPVKLVRERRIRLESDKVRDYLSQKTVLVTGAGGSIATQLIKTILTFGIKKLILVEYDKEKLDKKRQS